MQRREFLTTATAAALAATAPGYLSAQAGKPLKLLILGGTRFLGIHVTELALSRGHTITQFNRGKTNPGLFPQVEHLQGDRDGKLDALKGRKWDAVIDTSGFVPRIVRMSAELLAPNVQQYLFISTIGLYADLSKANDETSPVATVPDESTEDVSAAYGPLKALCEKTLQSVIPERNTIVRPGLIVGPEDNTERFTYWPVRATRGGEMLAPGPATAPFQIIDARDLATFILNAVESRTPGTFNVTSPTDLYTMGNIIEASVAAAHALAKPASPTTPTWVPADFLLQHKIAPFADLPGWVPQQGELAGIYLTKVDRAKKVGLHISPLEKTVRDTLAWHLKRPPAEQTTSGAGITPEREKEILTAWHAHQKA